VFGVNLEFDFILDLAEHVWIDFTRWSLSRGMTGLVLERIAQFIF